jgi:hypothetical protein
VLGPLVHADAGLLRNFIEGLSHQVIALYMPGQTCRGCRPDRFWLRRHDFRKFAGKTASKLATVALLSNLAFNRDGKGWRREGQ